jgi:hypothetical protein
MVRPEEWGVIERSGRGGLRAVHYTDQEMGYQQNLRGLKMALLVLSTNNCLIKAHVAEIMSAIEAATPSTYAEVEIPYEIRSDRDH